MGCAASVTMNVTLSPAGLAFAMAIISVEKSVAVQWAAPGASRIAVPPVPQPISST